MEEWKDVYIVDNDIVYDYRGYYQVNKDGKIKSLARKTNNQHSFKEKIIEPYKNKNGYLQVILYKNGKGKLFLLHRLIALVFIPNPNNKPQVNHEDGNKENCCVSNLVWSSQSENMHHSYNTGLHKKKYGKEHNNSKQVLQYDKEGNFIKEWDCIAEASRELNIDHSHISSCCKGKYKTTGGYVWKYKD